MDRPNEIDFFDPRDSPRVSPYFQLGELVIIKIDSYVRARDSLSITHSNCVTLNRIAGQLCTIVEIQDSALQAGVGRKRCYWYRILCSEGLFWVKMEYIERASKMR